MTNETSQTATLGALTRFADSAEPVMASIALRKAADIHSAAGQLDKALAMLEGALAHHANDPDTHESIGRTLLRQRRDHARALHHLMEASRLDPEDPGRILPALYLKRRLCDWNDFDQLARIELELAHQSPERLIPFHAILSDLPPTLLLDIARAASAGVVASPMPLPPRPLAVGKHPLTIGYLSSDFREHPVAHLLVRALELHDRSRVRVVGLALAPTDDSPVARRVVAALDQLVDLTRLDDQTAARRITDLRVDVLVDLNGHTELARPGIAAWRPAPVQVAWLGFPGTTGAPWIDYAIVDQMVAPYGTESDFSEALVRIGCYQSNDDRPEIATWPAGRVLHSLEDSDIVLCCFNQLLKINPPVFASWMRILAAVPESVLWLLGGEPQASAALAAAAAAAGIDPSRLVFAAPVEHSAHLARLAHADLVLDTRPYNAHTTASDALWMGVPVITWPGDAFQGRVAASLLTNVGLEELIVENSDAYERLAISLARDGNRRARLKAHLLGAGRRSRLFDAATHARELETAYERMIQRKARGQSPISFDVA